MLEERCDRAGRNENVERFEKVDQKGEQIPRTLRITLQFPRIHGRTVQRMVAARLPKTCNFQFIVRRHRCATVQLS